MQRVWGTEVASGSRGKAPRKGDLGDPPEGWSFWLFDSWSCV